MAELKSVLNQYYEKAKQHQKLIWFIFSVFAIAFVLYTVIWCYNLIFTYPVNQVSQITNVTENADLVNKYRTTSVQIVAIIAQIFGGVAILIGLYFAWGNLTTAREGQITERFTRAVDQLGNRKMEIRLGGIYALERIVNESKKDYWPIMEILTAYVRKNSSVEVLENKKVMHLAMHIQSNESTIREVPEERKISLDIQAVLTVLGERKYSFNNGEYKCLNLRKAHLKGADLDEAHLEGTNLKEAHLERANLREAHLEGANLKEAHLEKADLKEAHLEKADLRACLKIQPDLTIGIGLHI